MTNLPIAYKGTEPYIFVSYAHKNSDLVLPIIAQLQNRGFRVWYDAGIEAGTEWPAYIAEHLAACGCVIAMITKEALDSQNCAREIHFAVSKKIPILAVYLEEVVLPLDMELQLGVLQAIFYHRHPNMESFLEKLCGASILQCCKVAAVKQAETASVEDPSDPPKIVPKAPLSSKQNEFLCYSELAWQGDPHGQYMLGICYSEGRGVIASDEEAIRLWHMAAAQDYAPAQFKLGNCYAQGVLVGQDQEEAVRLWRLAAEQGYADAQYTIGLCCCLSLYGVELNEEEGARWLRLAADQGDAPAQVALGACYSKGKGVPKSAKEAARWYRMAAQQGDAQAQYLFGNCCRLGDGVNQSREEAAHWYFLAANQGNMDAAYEMGNCYSTGCGGPQDQEEALRWYKRAADRNHGPALIAIGRCYSNGHGVAQSDEEAVSWYLEAVNAACFSDRGNRHIEGRVVSWDINEAQLWHADVFYELGNCYREGRGVEQNDAEAASFYAAAANGDHADAQYQFGLCWKEGRGVRRNRRRARHWMMKAAQKGHGQAQQEFEELDKWWRRFFD